ncbi:glycosyltransferase family 4 protein [Thermosipho sp. 1074]|uniref:glycosyltransferase family 4 protein n=1 Tax=Thermosipho sp. 1074 TaxID=1643331 RepID=UPI00098776D7|nr:glycosyltransferase family 4 protein [Thermosipho sp. 1074]OOC44215.1 glycosyl transferase family 1 [Thermosipho sp. 1074]
MKKILILANNSLWVYNLRKELIIELLKNRYDVYFTTIEDNKDRMVKKLVNLGAKHIQIFFNRRNINPLEELRVIKEYRKIMRELNPDIVLTYTIKPNIYGTYVASKFDKPVIINITGLGSSFFKPILKNVVLKLYKYACKRATFVFFQNQFNYSLFVSNKIVLPNKAKIIPGSGVNIEKFKPIENEKQDEIVRFLFIGRIMREKGIEEYLKAADVIAKKYSNVEFQILGPFEEEEYRDIILSNKNPKIKYLGISDDVRNQIKEVDCIINPSYHEGMSNVLLEAGAMGKPLIASDIPGCREIVVDGYNGFLFEPKNVDSLINKVELFIHLPENERKKMGENSRKKIERDFNRNIVVKEYLKIIKKIIE